MLNKKLYHIVLGNLPQKRKIGLLKGNNGKRIKSYSVRVNTMNYPAVEKDIDNCAVRRKRRRMKPEK